ncbi:MAG: Ig-like domain repeat protein, partial [Candidatus Margulisbacteria bacterium]|nr:Ig-like domain repeat protein [Candidatus Margulisiibacteriota bacterium]
VNEPLRYTPIVKITQNGSEQSDTTIFDQGDNSYKAKYEVFSSADGINDGIANVNIEIHDRANNISLLDYDDLQIDTVSPVFSDIAWDTDYAKDGTEVTITFKSSEPLQFDPEVRVNGNDAIFKEGGKSIFRLLEYTYTYTVSWDKDQADNDKIAAISVNGFDPAMNEGTASADGFMIDMTEPVVEQQPDDASGALIARPSPFATNADPDPDLAAGENPVPRQTTLYYSNSEAGWATVKVYKVNNDTEDYTSIDFTAGNLAATLINSVWQEAGAQQTNWNGAGALPGKYAFIVELRDRAGNITSKKYGGTVWIQNNVLKLEEPELREIQEQEADAQQNPWPPVFSVTGNSTIKETTLWFRVQVRQDPMQVKDPHWISVLEANEWLPPDPTKKVGLYSVKVYDFLGNVVRTIAEDVEFSGGAIIKEDWDGKLEGGLPAPDGTYTIKVDVKDYLGAGAQDNLLSRVVVVDSTNPAIPSHSVTNLYFAPGGGANANSDKPTTTIQYRIEDNREPVKTTVEILGTEVLQNSADQTSNNDFTQLWNGLSAPADGKYSYRIYTIDEAGNNAEATGDVWVDSTLPEGRVSINAAYVKPGNDKKYTATQNIALTQTYSDATSGLEDMMSFKNDGGTWSAWEPLNANKNWTLSAGEGEKTVYVRYKDKAGNLNINEILDHVTVDQTAPVFGAVSVDDSHCPRAPNWSSDRSPIMTFSASDTSSGMRDYHYFINNVDQGVVTSPWHTTNLPDGQHVLRINAYDNVGNTQNTQNFEYWIDATAPYFESITISDTTYDGTWSNHNSPQFNIVARDATSGVNRIVGYIDGVSQGNVASNWHPTLSDGQHTAYLVAYDNAGNSISSSTYTFRIDTIVPVINHPGSTSFNPYLNTVPLAFTAVEGGSGIKSARAEISSGPAGYTIRTLSLSGNYSTSWDGKNNAGDYMNEGTYTLRIIIEDNAGNVGTNTACGLVIADDQIISNGSEPGLHIENSFLLSWVTTSRSEGQLVEANGHGAGGGEDNKWIYIE